MCVCVKCCNCVNGEKKAQFYVAQVVDADVCLQVQWGCRCHHWCFCWSVTSMWKRLLAQVPRPRQKKR